MKKILVALLCVATLMSVACAHTVVSAADIKEPAGIRWFPVPENRRNDDVWEVECEKLGCLCQGFDESVEDTGKANFLDTVYGKDGSLTITRNGNDKTNGIYWPRIRTISLETAPAFDLKTADTFYFDFTAHKGTTWNIMLSVNGMNVKFSKIISDAAGVTGVANSDADGGAGTYKGSFNIQDALNELAAESGTESSINAQALKTMKKTFVPQLAVFCVGEVGASITLNELYISTDDDPAGDNCTFVDMGLLTGLGDDYYDIYDEDPIIGDLNDDHAVNASDATILFYHINGFPLVKDDHLTQADLNKNNIIDLDDAVRLFYYVNGLL